MRIAVCVALAAVVAAGCDRAPEPSSRLSTTTDSAGVAIVRGPATDVPLPWTFVELLRIGGADSGAQAFDQATPFTVGTDGQATIAVLDRDQNTIQLFDSAGTAFKKLGGKGGGPGETEWPQGIDLAPTGFLTVYDEAKSALVRWDSAGTILPEMKFLTGRGRTWGAPRQRSDTVWAAIDVTNPSDSSTNVRRLEQWTPSDTIVLDSTVGARPKMAMFKCVGLALAPLFTGELTWSLSSGRIATTHQSLYVVNIVQNGRLTRSIRRDIVPVAARTTDAAKLYPEGLKVRFGTSGECVTPSAEIGEKVGVAPTLPLVRGMVIAPDGSVWVARYTFEGETPSLDVFDADGAYVGTASGKSLPLGFLSNDRVLFPIKNDDDGTSVIGVYRIQRAATRR